MIDIHSHIIFGVDDGPDTIEETLALIAEAYKQGVREIVATSHRRKGMFETPEEVIRENFEQVKQGVAQQFPDLTLYYGGELYYTSDILRGLDERTRPRLADTNYALIEFSSGTPWKDIHSALTNVLMLGVTPIVAHIERYNALAYDKAKVREIINMGCYTQINSSSVLKPKLFGDKTKEHKKRARYFLDKELVHCVASDMHNLTQRPPYMKEAYNLIARDFGVDRAEELFLTNPKTFLDNDFL